MPRWAGSVYLPVRYGSQRGKRFIWESTTSMSTMPQHTCTSTPTRRSAAKCFNTHRCPRPPTRTCRTNHLHGSDCKLAAVSLSGVAAACGELCYVTYGINMEHVAANIQTEIAQCCLTSDHALDMFHVHMKEKRWILTLWLHFHYLFAQFFPCLIKSLKRDSFHTLDVCLFTALNSSYQVLCLKDIIFCEIMREWLSLQKFFCFHCFTGHTKWNVALQRRLCFHPQLKIRGEKLKLFKLSLNWRSGSSFDKMSKLEFNITFKNGCGFDISKGCHVSTKVKNTQSKHCSKDGASWFSQF